MRFITISAAVLIGSALSAAHAQKLEASKQLAPQQLGAANDPRMSKVALEHLQKGYSGPSMGSFVSGGADACPAATPIAGGGIFLGDNIGATTDGPAACGAFGADVWYDWLSPATGPATFSLCGAGTTYDTTLAIYDGPACFGPLIACNDDACPGFKSSLTVPVVGGSIYKIRIGGFGGSTGSYELAITPPAPPAASDSCATPDVAVTGVNPFDLAGNTTGPEGQAEGICLFFGQTGISSDEWHTWIADCSGIATVNTCGQTGVDTKISVYAGAGCPTGASLACNDDACAGSLQSEISFPVVGGSAYTIQLGTFPGAGTGAGTFTITCTAVAGPEDNCATPAVAVTGVNPFDLAANTTGPEGQAEGICLFFGQVGIDSDEWHTWIADCTGTATVTTCAQTGVDTKISAYDGAGCPTSGSLACNDDNCGLQSTITFPVISGNAYTIQLGTFPGAGTGAGTFTISCDAPPPPAGPCDVLDDGTTENSVGTGNPAHDILWMHSQGEIGLTTVVKSISTAWGTPLFGGGNAPPAGSPARVGIWSDPNGDGDPTDAVLIQAVNTFIANPDTDILQTVNLSPSVLVTGKYFIGASCAGGTFQAPLDQSSGPGAGKVWIVGSTIGALDYTNLAGEEIPPLDEDNVAPGHWLLRGDCKDIAITEMCAADGMNCPCGNNGLVGNGCGNSVNAAGAHLSGSGNSIISADTVSVVATGVRKGNPTLALFFSGSETMGINPVNDGLLCAGAPICRLWTWSIPGPAGGTITLTGPDATTIPPSVGIAQRSADLGRPIMNSETRIYTVWYRDPANFACASPALSNYTNGLRILWSQ